MGAAVLTFVAAKIYFLFSTRKSLALAAIPAVILILSTPVEAGASDEK